MVYAIVCVMTSPGTLRAERDVLDFLRARAISTDELYRACESAGITARANGAEVVHGRTGTRSWREPERRCKRCVGPSWRTGRPIAPSYSTAYSNCRGAWCSPGREARRGKCGSARIGACLGPYSVRRDCRATHRGLDSLH